MLDPSPDTADTIEARALRASSDDLQLVTRLLTRDEAAFEALVDQMGETIRTLGELPPDPVHPEVREKLLDRFRNWKP